MTVHHSIDFFKLPTSCTIPLFFNNMYFTLRSSTCFKQHPAHPQEDKLYYYSLWYRHRKELCINLVIWESLYYDALSKIHQIIIRHYFNMILIIFCYCIIVFTFYISYSRILIDIANYTELFKMIVGVLTTCHTQYTWDRSICIFLFNRTTLQAFVTYLTGALHVHPLWFYNHQHENRVRSKLSVACQLFAFRRHLSKLRSKRRNA